MKQLASLVLLSASAAFAQGKTDYVLNEGQVHFRVPPGWTALMEKADGNPQAIAFQVPDEAAQGSEDTASVTVKTRQLQGAAQYAGVVQDEIDRAKAQPGYEKDEAGKDVSVHQYFVQRAKTRYRVRDAYVLAGTVAIEVRCQRPLLEKTPEAWNRQFDGACSDVVASLKP